MKRIGFVLRQGSPQAEQVLARLGPPLQAQGLQIVLVEDAEARLAGARVVPQAELARTIDLLVVLGGDGTFLWGASLVAHEPVPLLGINVGSLGFLTAFLPEEAEVAIAQALEGKLPAQERMRLFVNLVRDGGQTEEFYALNDCVVSQGAIARLLDIEALLDGVPITTYKADGLIVSTPTGSTAYNLAAGGPLLTPELQALVVTPICPHTLTNRPLVAPGNSRITVRAGKAGRTVMTIDGQMARELGPQDRIEICQAQRPVRLLQAPTRGFFDILRQKLRWGERYR